MFKMMGRIVPCKWLLDLDEIVEIFECVPFQLHNSEAVYLAPVSPLWVPA